MTSNRIISKNCLIGLITETALHAGAGSAVGVVDLPIQREGHNGWPCVFGSSVKGALRTHAFNQWGGKDPEIATLFGPEHSHENDKTHAGALAIGDARLLLLPVRSLTSTFRWVTCPEALSRLRRDADRLNVALPAFIVSTPEDTQALIASEHKDALFLEEYRFAAEKNADTQATAEALSTLIRRDGIQKELEKRLTIVSDDMFSTLVQSAIPVNAHITIESERKTAKEGGLWYEESLPPETVLYVAVIAHRGRKEGNQMGPEQVMQDFSDLLKAKDYWLQIGGNETLGMGWCAVKQVLEGTA